MPIMLLVLPKQEPNFIKNLTRQYDEANTEKILFTVNNGCMDVFIRVAKIATK